MHRTGLARAINREWQELTTIHPSDRPAAMAVAAAVAIGLPVLIGAATGHGDAVIASVGRWLQRIIPARLTGADDAPDP